MKALKRYIILGATLVAVAMTATAQNQASSGSVVRKRDAAGERNATTTNNSVSQRMQSHFETTPVSDADLSWMRVIYRELDLTKDRNTPLYFPDEPVDGQENLFRIIMRLLANDQIAAYEYLDGREVFTDKYRIKVKDMLDRFHVIYTPAKGSNDKHPRFVIDDSDVPANEVLTYYIVERWEFDNRSNRMRTVIEAICPVLHRSGDFGGEAVRYPMFWVKFDDLRPFLTTQNIFTSDDNNLATCNYDDYFQLGLYQGDIYKTRNLRNQSLMQLFPDPEERAHAQDSIQRRLDTFSEKLWVKDPEAVAAAKAVQKPQKEVAAATGEETDAAAQEAPAPKADDKKMNNRTKRGSSSSGKGEKSAKPKKPKAPKSTSSSSSNAARSVRNRKK